MCLPVNVCIKATAVLNVFHHSLIYFLKRGLSLNLELPNWLEGLMGKFLGYTCPSPRDGCTTPGVLHGWLTSKFRPCLCVSTNEDISPVCCLLFSRSLVHSSLEVNFLCGLIFLLSLGEYALIPNFFISCLFYKVCFVVTTWGLKHLIFLAIYFKQKTITFCY